MSAEKLDDVISLLYSVGSRMCADAMKSDHLARNKRDFIHAWGRLLQEGSHWVLSQREAGILEETDIVEVVRLHIDVATTYRELSPVVDDLAKSQAK